MKIGLVRHFEVECQLPGYLTLMTPNQFRQWLDEYEMSDIKDCRAASSLTKWKKCFSSDSRRAVKTAKKLFDGPIIETEALRELAIFPPTNRNIKLPILLWLILGRMAWMLAHKSQRESKLMFDERLKYILEEIILKEEDDVLIVSHGFLMMFLRKELLKRGFQGPNFKKAENGKIYVFEKISRSTSLS